MANDPNVIHKLFTSRANIPAGLYVGEQGRMFYSEADGCLRLSDGVTPGGLPACGGAGITLPDQTAHNGEFLTTDGTNLFWAPVVGTTPFGVKTGDITIPAGQTRDIDSTSFTTYAASKWLVTVKDSINSKLQSYEVHGHFLLGQPSSVHNVTGHLGDRIHNIVSVAIVGTAMILRITNNEAYTIVVRSAKYDITS
jgi:hypothetical protein